MRKQFGENRQPIGYERAGDLVKHREPAQRAALVNYAAREIVVIVGVFEAHREAVAVNCMGKRLDLISVSVGIFDDRRFKIGEVGVRIHWITFLFLAFAYSKYMAIKRLLQAFF
jgi:hypothetical protein